MKITVRSFHAEAISDKRVKFTTFDMNQKTGIGEICNNAVAPGLQGMNKS